MADIAILVAEEYERRMKTSRHLAGAGSATAGGVTTVTVSGGAAGALAELLRVEKAAAILQDLEPRSEIGAAAFKFFFSA